MSSFASFVQRHFTDNAYLLLAFTALCWGGNTVAGRLAVGEVSPFVVVFLRWVIVASLMGVLYHRQLRKEWPVIRAHLPRLILSGLFGFTVFNSLFYIAAHQTTAVNMGILQGSMPVQVLIGSIVLFHTRVFLVQVLGILLTLAGVGMVAAGGSLQTLLHLSVNTGDGLMLIACLCYSGYTLSLRNRPKISGIVFFTVLAIAAAFASVPGLAYEYAADAVQWPTPKGWLVVLFIALFPSCLSQLFFMRGVELIGPARAGIFVNLVPVFGAILAVLILGEPFHTYHALALTLVLGGIWLAERKKI